MGGVLSDWNRGGGYIMDHRGSNWLFFLYLRLIRTSECNDWVCPVLNEDVDVVEEEKRTSRVPVITARVRTLNSAR